jgi:NTP pyrophosphatase (non-canonical NTP hydrolase)
LEATQGEKMKTIDELTRKVIAFRDARDWKQFHNPKDVALSLVLEAGEVMEHFQWRNESDIEEYLKSNKSLIGEELADVLYWVLLLSHDLGIDIEKALAGKLVKNGKKYPLKKAKGSKKKYNELLEE